MKLLKIVYGMAVIIALLNASEPALFVLLILAVVFRVA